MEFNDPRMSDPLPPPNGNFILDKFVKDKLAQVVRRKVLGDTIYTEPDDTCDCDEFVTTPRVIITFRPPYAKPPSPRLPPPLPPPPRRYEAPQLPNVIPPFIQPPPSVFGGPNIIIDSQGDDDGDDGGTGDEGTTTPGVSTISPPTTTAPPDGGRWEKRIVCCGSTSNDTPPTDIEMAAEIEDSSHSGEFKNGCYPVCSTLRIPVALGDFDAFCRRRTVQICKCYMKNNASSPCYKGNGQISPPGANITSTAAFKRLPLPLEYDTEEQYYADLLIPT